jgi:hypothetical protein
MVELARPRADLGDRRYWSPPEDTAVLVPTPEAKPSLAGTTEPVAAVVLAPLVGAAELEVWPGLDVSAELELGSELAVWPESAPLVSVDPPALVEVSLPAALAGVPDAVPVPEAPLVPEAAPDAAPEPDATPEPEPVPVFVPGEPAAELDPAAVAGVPPAAVVPPALGDPGLWPPAVD